MVQEVAMPAVDMLAEEIAEEQGPGIFKNLTSMKFLRQDLGKGAVDTIIVLELLENFSQVTFGDFAESPELKEWLGDMDAERPPHLDSTRRYLANANNYSTVLFDTQGGRNLLLQSVLSLKGRLLGAQSSGMSKFEEGHSDEGDPSLIGEMRWNRMKNNFPDCISVIDDMVMLVRNFPAELSELPILNGEEFFELKQELVAVVAKLVSRKGKGELQRFYNQDNGFVTSMVEYYGLEQTVFGSEEFID